MVDCSQQLEDDSLGRRCWWTRTQQLKEETRTIPARDFRTQKEERRTQIRARIRAQSISLKKDDHGGKMLTQKMSGVRRAGREGRGSTVDSREVKRPGQRGVDRDLIVIVLVLRKKPARGITRARESERTKELMHLPAPGLRGVGNSPFVLRSAFGRSGDWASIRMYGGLGRTRTVCLETNDERRTTNDVRRRRLRLRPSFRSAQSAARSPRLWPTTACKGHHPRDLRVSNPSTQESVLTPQDRYSDCDSDGERHGASTLGQGSLRAAADIRSVHT